MNRIDVAFGHVNTELFFFFFTYKYNTNYTYIYIYTIYIISLTTNIHNNMINIYKIKYTRKCIRVIKIFLKKYDIVK